MVMAACPVASLTDLGRRSFVRPEPLPAKLHGDLRHPVGGRYTNEHDQAEIEQHLVAGKAADTCQQTPPQERGISCRDSDAGRTAEHA